ncbi:hypothetical protein ACFVJ5_01175 [Nocardia sp. NPDC127606]|uniref:hypothetical protein n=1 Tax=Nocardia sp. NPDC127606 TaxID=3345406 RepID=UPI003630E854
MQDSDSRDAVRRTADYQTRERAAADTTGLHHDLAEAVRALVGDAIAAGIPPQPPAVRPPSSMSSPPATPPPSTAPATPHSAAGSSNDST